MLMGLRRLLQFGAQDEKWAHGPMDIQRIIFTFFLESCHFLVKVNVLTVAMDNLLRRPYENTVISKILRLFMVEL